MGRPKAVEEEKRSVIMPIRLTVKEHKTLQATASVCGKPIGVLVRAKLFKGKFPQPKMSKIDTGVYVELKKIGVNINQLARHANSQRYIHDIRADLRRLAEQQNLIIQLLLNDSHSEDR